MTDDFDERYLPLVCEEAAEVIQAITKIQRFGSVREYPDGKHNGRSNLKALAFEVGDLLEVIDRLGLPENMVRAGREVKAGRLKIWGPDGKESEQ